MSMNYGMSTVDQDDDDKRRRRKLLIGVTAVALAAVLILFASFVLLGRIRILLPQAAAAHAVGIRGALVVSVNGIPDADGVIENLNPGDVIRIGGNISNIDGTPVWVRYQMNVTPESAAIGQYLEPVPVIGASTSAPHTDGVGAGPYTSRWVGAKGEGTSPWILSGRGANVIAYERSVSLVPVDTVLIFDPAATNAAQGKGVTMTVTVQGAQYQDNAEPDWSHPTEISGRFSIRGST